MKTLTLALLALLTAVPAMAFDDPTPASVVSRTIVPGEVTTLHLRPEFESVIHFPEPVTSVVLGDPEKFKGEHSEGEPEYVYVKPTTRRPSQSNLLVALKSGQHVMLELVNDGVITSAAAPVDFLLEYKRERGFLVNDVSLDETATKTEPGGDAHPSTGSAALNSGAPATALDLEYAQQQRIHDPAWTKWPDNAIETSVGDTRQWENQVAVSFSVFNPTAEPLEIVPPQVQISGLKLKKAKHGLNVTADQLEVRDYRLSATRLEPGERADGVVLFDRPNYKQSSEQLFLQIAEAAKVDQPVLVRLPFTPPIAGSPGK